jgi:long-chain acyl-CoA synthetase
MGDHSAVEDGVLPLTFKRLTLLASAMRRVALRETSQQLVGLMLPASSILYAAFFGVLWSAKTVVPLNFLLSPDELARIVRDAGLDLILTIRPFRDLAGQLPARVLYVDELPLKRRVLAAMLWRLPPGPTVDPNTTAVLLYTSGTTAEPKGVELTHHNLYSNCTDSVYSLGLERPQTVLNILPPFHVFGLTAGVLLPAVLGATVHAIPRFSPVAVLKTVSTHGITIMMAIPSMYAALLRAKSSKPDTFASVKLAISGGEPLPDRIRTGFKERFGVTLCEGYGLTETSPIIAADAPASHRPGTVGRPIRHVDVRIVSPDGEPSPVGCEGEILVRGPGVMKGYYRKPDETRNVLDADGWFRTGDIGRMDEQGYLSITGRAKEMLIVGGENVFPREIEAVLEAHDSVLQAAVIGIHDESRGEVPVAFVVPKPGAQVSDQELRQAAKRALAGFKVPRRIYIRDDLPAGPTGKILKRRLHELL